MRSFKIVAYTPGHFGDAAHSMYPAEWEQAGSLNSGGRSLQATHALIYVATAILTGAILLKGIAF